MIIPIPKIGYNKKSGKNDQVMALFYNCHFYYQQEAQKCPVLCSGRGSRITFPIPKIGYNKNSSKN